jgi:hypothetical protein
MLRRRDRQKNFLCYLRYMCFFIESYSFHSLCNALILIYRYSCREDKPISKVPIERKQAVYNQKIYRAVSPLTIHYGYATT